MKNQIFTSAWALVERGLFASFSEALSKAWQIYRIKRALRANACFKFKYKTKDGKLRKARGTLSESILAGYPFKSSAKPAPPHIVKYFDLKRGAFRSFDIRRFRGLA